MQDWAAHVTPATVIAHEGRYLLAIPSRERLERVERVLVAGETTRRQD